MSAPTDVLEAQPPGEQDDRTGRSAATPRRVRVAQALALVALAASLLGALGPAERVRTTYSWPPATVPEAAPDRTWYAPLLLARHRPDALSLTLPCRLAPALPDAPTPTTVFATARRPENVEGLSVTRFAGGLEIAVGGTVLERVDPERTAGDGDRCGLLLRTAGNGWSLETAGGELLGEGRLERAPVVTGLFSNVDVGSPGAPSAQVTTAVHATRTTPLQAAAWTVAALACAGALLLVSLGDRRRRAGAALRDAFRALRRHARAADLVVFVVLAGWWVISPAYFDDGWVAAREQMFSESRGFPTYYSTFGVNMPLDYWIEWLHHWIAQSTLSLVANRLPAVLCLLAIWALCRWTAVRVVGRERLDGIPLWTLAAVFLIGAISWGITLRPEPVTALFVTAVMACMVRFLETRSVASVALAAACVAFALSAHPAGVVSLAAIVVVSPQLVRWLRPNAAAATAIVAASLALLALLLFVGADLEQRRADAQITRTYGFSESWRDELTRYSLLVQHHYGTPLRRISVALIGLAALGFLLRRRRGERTLLDVPGSILVAGLVLLILTPSKWPSHFGTLLGVAAVAFCCEVVRAWEEGSAASRWRAWPFVAVAAGAGGVSWAWLVREQWNVADLRTLDWTPGFEATLPVALLSALLPLLALGLALLVARLRRVERPYVVPWRVTSWLGLLVAVPVLGVTTAMLVADTAKTESWTLARQNLSDLAGRDAGCGLADDLVVPVRDSARALPPAAGGASVTGLPAWVPDPPAPGLPRYALGPAGEGSGATPWFALPRDERFGLFVAGSPGASDRMRLEWGAQGGTGVARLSASELDAAVGPLTGDTPWRMLAAGDLPEPPEGATAVRATLTSGTAPGPAVAVSAPVTYESERLVRRMAAAEARTLVLPNLLMYFPCTRLPVFADGIVEPPDHVVSWRNQFSPFRYQLTSPFVGVTDLYDLVHLPTADSERPPEDVVAFDVDRGIPGAALLPPDAVDATS